MVFNDAVMDGPAASYYSYSCRSTPNVTKGPQRVFISLRLTSVPTGGWTFRCGISECTPWTATCSTFLGKDDRSTVEYSRAFWRSSRTVLLSVSRARDIVFRRSVQSNPPSCHGRWSFQRRCWAIDISKVFVLDRCSFLLLPTISITTRQHFNSGSTIFGSITFTQNLRHLIIPFSLRAAKTTSSPHLITLGVADWPIIRRLWIVSQSCVHEIRIFNFLDTRNNLLVHIWTRHHTEHRPTERKLKTRLRFKEVDARARLHHASGKCLTQFDQPRIELATLGKNISCLIETGSLQSSGWWVL